MLNYSSVTTFHTKEFALEYGRDLFAVPGNINSPKSELPNILIKSAQAECVLSGDDILEYVYLFYLYIQYQILVGHYL